MDNTITTSELQELNKKLLWTINTDYMFHPRGLRTAIQGEGRSRFNVSPYEFTITVDISDVSIIVPNKVVEVTFKDGTKEKAVCKAPDVFSLETAISICVSKKIMGGSGAYNNAIRNGIKVYEDKLKKEEAEKLKQERIEKKRAKRLAYKKRRAARLAEEAEAKKAAEREEQIEIQKEAYIRAMKHMSINQLV